MHKEGLAQGHAAQGHAASQYYNWEWTSVLKSFPIPPNSAAWSEAPHAPLCIFFFITKMQRT